MSVAIYPGSFDPITYGHLDIAARAIAGGRFSKLIIGIAKNSDKTAMLPSDQRKKLIAEVAADMKLDISVETYTGATVDFARAMGANTIIRGLRSFTDFEYEFQIALTNKAMAPDIETFFIMADPKHSVTSSRIVKEIFKLGKDVSQYLHPKVVGWLIEAGH